MLKTLFYPTLLFILLCSFTITSTAQNHQWLSTKWEVYCSSDMKETLPDTADYNFECDQNNISGAAANARYDLQEASKWLKGLGFRGPVITILPTVNFTAQDSKTIIDPKDGSEVKNVVGVSYVAYISDKKNEDTDGSKSYGLYNTNNVLYLSSDTYFTLKGQSGKDKIGTSVHELFHAVENAYMGDEQFRGGNKYDWMTEGMADAVILAYLDKMHPGQIADGVGIQYANNDRYYDYPLHEPKDVKDKTCGECYNTRTFWFSLGGILKSEGRIAYLHDVLSEDMKPNAGIDATHKALTKYHKQGLYHYYPEFIQNRSDKRLLGIMYDNPKSKKYTFNNQAQKDVHSGKVKKIATDAYGFIVNMPPNKVAGVKISFETDLPDLHLIVGDERLDLPTEIDLTEERNIFRTSIAETDSFFVRVANIAPKPGESVDKDYKLVVEITPIEPCSGEVMMSALHPHLLETTRAMEKMSDQLSPYIMIQSGGQFSGFQNIIKPAKEFEKEFEPIEGMHPSIGELQFSGMVTDKGNACVDHIGTNPLMEMAEEDAEIDEAAMEKRVTEMLQNRHNMSPEELQKMMQETTNIAEQMAKGVPSTPDKTMAGEMFEVAAGTEGSTLLKIYSPNAISWQWDAIAEGRNFKHSGIGGWKANSAAQILLKIKGVSPSQLQENKEYEVVMMTESIDDEAEMPAYVSWVGREHRLPMEEGDIVQTLAFEGMTELVALNKIRGKVKITKLTGADVQGTLNLVGSGYKETEKYKFTYDDKNRIDGDEIEDTKTVQGQLKITGSFKAPAVAEVTRIGKLISNTKKVR